MVKPEQGKEAFLKIKVLGAYHKTPDLQFAQIQVPLTEANNIYEGRGNLLWSMIQSNGQPKHEATEAQVRIVIPPGKPPYGTILGGVIRCRPQPEGSPPDIMCGSRRMVSLGNIVIDGNNWLGEVSDGDTVHKISGRFSSARITGVMVKKTWTNKIGTRFIGRIKFTAARGGS